MFHFVGLVVQTIKSKRIQTTAINAEQKQKRNIHKLINLDNSLAKQIKIT